MRCWESLVRFDDAEGVAAVALLALALPQSSRPRRPVQQTQGFEGDQLRVAGADADAQQATFLRTITSTSVARALTAATAMARYPRRPRTIT